MTNGHVILKSSMFWDIIVTGSQKDLLLSVLGSVLFYYIFRQIG